MIPGRRVRAATWAIQDLGEIAQIYVALAGGCLRRGHQAVLMKGAPADPRPLDFGRH
jgi:hypothetical protein